VPGFSFSGQGDREEKRMQTTIYYNEEDSYLVKQVDCKSQRERKSRSAVILSILEEYFESEKRLGEILVDIGVISHSELAKGLELQKTQFADKLLGDILLEEELVPPEAVERALVIQGRNRRENGGA
jgi:metal-responsive CopG/Arc/MetJ family transcriptional regulator